MAKTKIVAINPNGTIAGWFDCINDAAAYLHANRNNIGRCLSGKQRRCHGLMWYRYTEEFKRDHMLHPEKYRHEARPGHNLQGKFCQGNSISYKWNEEQKAAASERLKQQWKDGVRKPIKCFHPEAIPVVEIETGRTWNSIGECAKDIGIEPCTLSITMRRRGISGKYKRHYMRKDLYDKTNILARLRS